MFVPVEKLYSKKNRTVKDYFDKSIFKHLREIVYSSDVLVPTDIIEFYKIIDITKTIFNVEDSDEWVQLGNDYTVVLQNVSSYFKKGKVKNERKKV